MDDYALILTVYVFVGSSDSWSVSVVAVGYRHGRRECTEDPCGDEVRFGE